MREPNHTAPWSGNPQVSAINAAGIILIRGIRNFFFRPLRQSPSLSPWVSQPIIPPPQARPDPGGRRRSRAFLAAGGGALREVPLSCRVGAVPHSPARAPWRDGRPDAARHRLGAPRAETRRPMNVLQSVTIRPSRDTDLEAIAAIYGHHVRHGTASFETCLPHWKKCAAAAPISWRAAFPTSSPKRAAPSWATPMPAPTAPGPLIATRRRTRSISTPTRPGKGWGRASSRRWSPSAKPSDCAR